MLEIDVASLSRKSDSEIIEEIGMAYLPLIVLVFQKKYKGIVRFIDIGGDCMLRYGKTNIANMSYLPIYLHFLTIDNNVIHLEGNVSIPTAYRKHCSMEIMVNGESVDYVSFDADLDKSIDGEVYETRTAFKLDYKIVNDETEIKFKLITKGIESYCNKINCMRFMPVADVIKNQYKIIDEFAASIEGNALKIRKLKSAFEKNDYENRLIASISENANQIALEAIELRREYFNRLSQKKNRIWLFFDRIDKADDNGEVLFRYVNNIKPEGVDTYYIIDETSPDYKRLLQVGNVIPAMTKEHKLLLLLADYIFTSQLNGFVENPFGEASEYYRDLYHDPKIVFLQHGVTKDDQSKWLHRYKHNMYSIIASSPMEKKGFLNPEYGLSDEQIWLTGMPRFDNLYHNEKRQLLIMPTWRKSLMYLKEDKDTGLSRWTATEDFENSEYIRKYNSLLNSKQLKSLCDKYNYEAAYVPHPLSRPYESLFKVPDWIKQYPFYANYKDIFAESDLMITDYSSVAFDFAYLKKPVIYYQFDKRSFFKNHTYKKGYFDYKRDGFGEIATNELTLMLNINTYLKGQCKLKNKYSDRIHSFFLNTDNDNCKRIIEKILIKGE